MKKFLPNIFLMALGAGGIAVSGFVFLNYTVEHGKGLITFAQLHSYNFSLWNQIVYGFMEIYMVIFALIHLLLTVYLLPRYFSWVRTQKYQEIKLNPLLNSSLLIPFVSFFMTFNVVLSVVRYFVPALSNNLQSIMSSGFVLWLALWLVLMFLEITILKNSFLQKFDLEKVNFSWLMQPFSLGMATVTGTGIAAMATNPNIAHAAAFVSAISFTLAIFLLILKLTVLFKKSFSMGQLPDNNSLPSFFMVIPIWTVLGISAFRYGHYLERQFDFHLGAYFVGVILLTFAFQTWYLFFSLVLSKDYISKNLFKEYHISQWGLVCPLVAYGVMGSFVYANFVANAFLLNVIVALSILFVIFYLYLLVKQLHCCGLVVAEDKK
ncbi:MAG: hypothetical protein WAV16_03920 [Candidatus Moraniibacteriota bacterium]